MKTLPGLSVFLLAFTLHARAGLEFESTVLTRTARASDNEVTGEFKFKVTGEKTVNIKDIASYCSCLKAVTKGDKLQYKPGEEGVVEVAFQLGSFEGEVTKQVDILSDDTVHPEIQLGVKVTIPPVFKMEPESVRWDVGEEAKAKTIKVTVMDEKEIAITGLESSRENMVATLKEVKKGREYEVTLTPKSTADPMLGILRVETNAPYPRFQKRLLFFSVTKPKAPGAKAPEAGAAAADKEAPKAPQP